MMITERRGISQIGCQRLRSQEKETYAMPATGSVMPIPTKTYSDYGGIGFNIYRANWRTI